jgi:parvulin-like peptidyl-prolyl isomerase
VNKDKALNILLVLGVFVGISLAIFSSIQDTNFEVDNNWVARVGDIEISREKYLLQLEGLNLDKRAPLKEEDRAFVLERMIEEELLIQRAKDLGMFSTNTMIRGAIVQQMINMIISENSLDIVSTSQLKEFYEENKGFFTSADRLRLKQIYFSDEKGGALERAQNAYLYLVQGNNLDVIDSKSDESALEVPNTLMTLSKVREYIGPSLMQLAKMLKPGEFTSPKKVIGGYKIIVLLERRDASPPDFKEIRDRVKSEYQKRKDDEALRDYLNKLKKWYEIERQPKI